MLLRPQPLCPIQVLALCTPGAQSSWTSLVDSRRWKRVYGCMLIVTCFNNQTKMLATQLGSWPFESFLGLEVVLASPDPSVSTKKKGCHSALEAPCLPIVSATVKCRSRGPALDPRSQRSCLSVGRKTLSTGNLPFPCPISVCSVKNLRLYTSFWSLMDFVGHCSVIPAVNTDCFTVRHFAVLSFATRSASGAPGFWHAEG